MRNCSGKSFSGRILGRIIVLCMILGMGFPAAQAEMAQKPLFLVGNVGPNILLIVDDSGSMFYEVIPDAAYGTSSPTAISYLFPPDHTNVYKGGAIYDNSNATLNAGRIPTFKDDWYNSYYRSAHNNPLFYNPAKTYKPWVRHDGTPYPDAPPHAAPDNPGYYYDYETGSIRGVSMTNRTRNLKEQNKVVSVLSNSYCASNSSDAVALNTSDTFWPAFYFQYKGSGDVKNFNSYDKVEIRPETDFYREHGRGARTDCADAGNNTCTYEEEIQNFANWYSYHRSRANTAKAGLGQAFRNVGDAVRVGYGSINKATAKVDNVDSNVVRRGVRAFYGGDKIEFYRYLYEAPVTGATPLRKALDGAGQYYMRTDNRGPWGNTPGQDDGTRIEDQISCRSCYTVLMSDGYYNTGSNPSNDNQYAAETGDARKDTDNTDGPTTHTSPVGTGDPPVYPAFQYKYKAVSPFKAESSNTLADVAMYYWKKDLRGNLPNNVPTAAGVDPAFWQHMVTFTVGFGVEGTIKPEDAFAAMRSSNANSKDSDSPPRDGDPEINWPAKSNVHNYTDAEKIDDLLHAAVNGRGDFLSASDPDALAEGMEAILGEVARRSSGSVSAIATNSTSTSDSTLLFQAFMDSFDWTGGVRTYKMKADGTIDESGWWDTRTTGKIPGTSDRKLYTSHSGTEEGISFLWDRLSAEQKEMLRVDTASIKGDTDPKKTENGQNRLNWLRGDQSKEIKNGGVFRNRSVLIGDIVFSDPALVNPGLDFGYGELPPHFSFSSYKDFVSTNAARKPVLYVGANDGMLHAFDASGDKTAGGSELFAYIPNLVFEKLVQLPDPSYTHQFYVNGSPAIGHAYWDGAWRTVLVGSLGAGGKGLFALDVTDAGTFDENKVLWEMDQAKLGVEDWKDIGYMLGPPVLAYTKDGSAVAIFGNGYESENGEAYLMIVNLQNGSLIKKIKAPRRTEDGLKGIPNGLSTVTLLSDEHRIVSRVYAGDLHGQVWQFDLSSDVPSSWHIGNGDNPLFIAKDFANNDERLIPITAPIAVRNHPSSTGDEHKGYLLYFGTGAFYDEQAHTILERNTSNAFYCIWDRNDGTTIGKELDDYVYAAYDPGDPSVGNNTGSLLQQHIIYELSGSDLEDSVIDFEVRIVSDYGMKWYSGEDDPGYRGWYLPLIPPAPKTDVGERVTAKASLRNNKVLFATMIPSTEDWEDPCTPNAESWFMQLDAFTGGRTGGPAFDLNRDGSLSDMDLARIAGKQYAVSGVKEGAGVRTLGAFLSVGNLQIALLSNSEGSGIETWGIGDTKLPESGRHSWREVFISR